MMGNLKDRASDVVDRIRDAVTDKDKSDVKNEMFEELEKDAHEQLDDARRAADDMQRRLEALMRGETGDDASEKTADDAEEPSPEETRE